MGGVVEGVVTRTVSDSAAILDVVAGPDRRSWNNAPAPERPFLDEVAADSGSLRVALMDKGSHGMPTDPECTAAAQKLAKALQEMGHSIEGRVPFLDHRVATLAARIPFLHFFDGFRTSHEIAKIAELSEAEMRAMIDLELVFDHRARALTPDRPVVRGTAQNPDVFFQAREAANPFYDATPGIVAEVMDELAARTGRRYGLVEYVGAPDAGLVRTAGAAPGKRPLMKVSHGQMPAIGTTDCEAIMNFAASLS